MLTVREGHGMTNRRDRPKNPDVLTVDDLQVELECGRAQAYNIVRTIPHFRVGKSIRIDRADLEAWKSEQKAKVAG